MTISIRIDPDGTVTPLDITALAAGRDLFENCSVLTCGAPIFDVLDVHLSFVGVIDDFGAQDQPLNPKAWACYGRSPIFGTMFIGIDGGGELSAALVATISEPIGAWVPAHVVALMEQADPESNRPDMLSERPSP